MYEIKFSDRSEEKINIVEQYLKATKQFRHYDDESQDPVFTKVEKKTTQNVSLSIIYFAFIFQVITLDLSTVVSSLSGPKRPHDRIDVKEMKKEFAFCLTNKVSSSVYATNIAQ